MKIGLKKGFTLIELLIVIAIIGILAVALLPTILGAPSKGRDAARKSLLSSAMTAVEAFNLEVGSYPYPGTGTTAGKGCLNAMIVKSSSANNDLRPFLQGGQFPMDPLGVNTPNICSTTIAHKGQFLYGNSIGTGKNYFLASWMETVESSNATEGELLTNCTGATDCSVPVTKPTACPPLGVTNGPASGGLRCVYIMVK